MVAGVGLLLGEIGEGPAIGVSDLMKKSKKENKIEGEALAHKLGKIGVVAFGPWGWSFPCRASEPTSYFMVEKDGGVYRVMTTEISNMGVSHNSLEDALTVLVRQLKGDIARLEEMIGLVSTTPKTS